MENSPNTLAETVTMCDVLQEEQELEEDANAVLGGSDDTYCSYNKGYVPRQALYACKTCQEDGQEAGICLACCYKCHDDHEVVELYTKRNFRCDCGNSKFGGKQCRLNPVKDPLNALNSYNQNFRGLYCSCSRPYPDLEDDTPDEMIQCVLCEDWFHGRHLKTRVPTDYFEMTCATCMDSHSFLYSYLDSYIVDVDDTLKPASVPNNIKTEPATLLTDIKLELGSNCNGSSSADTFNDQASSLLYPKDGQGSSSIKVELKTENGSHENTSTVVNSVKIEPSSSDVKNENKPCILKSFGGHGIIRSRAVFWPENWRKDLCRCDICLDLYTKTNCAFLLNPEDTVHAYEEKGRGKSESQYDRGMSALSQLDRVNQMEAVRAYTSMKGQLKEYLKEFADNQRTVRESDIKEFFERIGKKQKLNSGIPHFCR